MNRKSIGMMCAVAVGIAAVTTGVAPRASANEKQITIAVAMKTQVQRRWVFDQAAMEAEAARQGVKLVFQYANDSPSLQASQVENLLSQQPDVMIIVPVDSQAAGSLVRAAHEADVPVVGYDEGVATAKLDYFVTRNNTHVGELQAKAALKFGHKGNYALFKGDPGNDVAHAIGKAYDSIIKQNGDAKVVFDQFINGWSPQTALSNAENVLSANSDNIKAFVVANDGMATGVAQAIKGRNLAGKVFLSGLDADTPNLKLIAEGVQTMTVWTDLEDHGRSAIRAAIALARKEKPKFSLMFDQGAGEVPTHLVEVQEINKDNLCAFIKNGAPKGWTSVEEVFGSADGCK